MPKDYCDPSSDDLSSEWDEDHADVPDKGTNNGTVKESKVRIKPERGRFGRKGRDTFIYRKRVFRPLFTSLILGGESRDKWN